MSEKLNNPHTTFRFKNSIKLAFQEECDSLGLTMKEVLELMMVDFVKTSKNLKDAKRRQKESEKE